MKFSKTVYFDQAATSYPKPASVLRAFSYAVRREGGNPGRSGHPLSLRAAERVFSARETVADFFGLLDARSVVFTKNATEAINLAVSVFSEGGGHVLCDDMAHNALLRPLYALEDKGKISLSFFSFQDEPSVLEKMISPHTRLVCCTHASNICNAVCDAAAIGRICKKNGVAFLLDASQSAGHIPLDCSTLGADAVCFPAHKGLWGVMGAGAVLFPTPKEDYPAFLSGGSGSHSLRREMPRELPEHFEAGTLPLPAIAAFEAGVRQVAKVGVEEISSHIGGLEARLREGLGNTKEIRLHDRGTGNGILSFTHTSIPPSRFASLLSEEGFAVRAGLHCAPLAHRTLGTEKLGGTVRISLGYTNTLGECEKFLRALQRCIR